MTETNHELLTIATAVAKHLDGFTAQPFMGHAVKLVHPDGREIMLRHKDYNDKSRLSLAGLYPTDGRHRLQPRSDRDLTNNISVAATKSAEQIAKDIARRLLPDYSEGFLDTQDQMAKRSSDREGRLVTASRLGVAMRQQPRHEEDESVLYDSGGALYTVRVTGPDTVRFEHFYCTADEAERIIQATRR